MFTARSIFKLNFSRCQSTIIDKSIPNLLDLRVGFIKHIEKHPGADSLYVSQVALSPQDHEDEVKYVQIVSGLVNFLPMAELFNRRVVVVNNLKPSSMRGVKSSGMLLCSEKISDGSADGEVTHKVMPISPPAMVELGSLLEFKVSNDIKGNVNFDVDPKKRIKSKVWKEFANHLKSNNAGVVCWGDQTWTLGIEKDGQWREATVDSGFEECPIR
ncbi:hypothetical protein DAMA08_027360 [Martiniozyma asiatica (nom. inval.)]|nr:hypothetical protein DAMA08_027360 [Martiniozyma asiatica]